MTFPETLVELYSKPDCHLCDEAKDVLTKVLRHHPFRLAVIEIQEGTADYELYRERIPVVKINHEVAFHFRVPEKAFIAKLRAAESKG